jgi:hypothetical protein
MLPAVGLLPQPRLEAQETKPDDPDVELREALLRNAAPAKLSAVWYLPRQRKPNTQHPVALVLASGDLPAGEKEYWVLTPWRANYCTLVLKAAEDEQWSGARVKQVLDFIDSPPESIPADPKRILVVADEQTAPLAMRILDGYPERLIGMVLISAQPIERVAGGVQLWSPRKETRDVPLWVVIGTKPPKAAAVLQMWRKFRSRAPREANITLDTRPDQPLADALEPDETFVKWLGALAEGKAPEPGPDRQAAREKKAYGNFARLIRSKMIEGPASPPGERETKRQGPLLLATTPPVGWRRFKEIERTFNPRLARNAALADQTAKDSPYVEMYFSPEPQSPFFAYVYGSPWENGGEDLLADYRGRLSRKGYLPVRLESWEDGQWTWEVLSILQVNQDEWHRWVVLCGSRDASEDNPASPMVMVMDTTPRPDAAAMAAAARRFAQSVQVLRGKSQPLTESP